MTFSKEISRNRPDVMMLGLRSIGSGQGGVEAHVEQLTDEIDQFGYSVEVIARRPYVAERVSTRGQAIRVVALWSTKGKSTEAILHSLLGVLYAAWRRPKVLHVHAIGPALITPLARLAGLRVVFTHHGEDYNREKWGGVARVALKLGERLGALFASERICVSSSLSRELSDRYGAPFAYIPNGFRIFESEESSSILERLGLERGRYVLHVGRVVPEKRQLDLIAAMNALEDTGHKLVLVGAADHPGGYSRRIDEEAAKSDRVVQAGFQTGADLAQLFRNARVFVLPSSHEGLPIALLEAMAYGCPVIASDIEANLNVVLPGSCYFPVGSIEALTNSIRSELRITRVGPVDWSGYLQSFNWTDIARQTIDTYRAASDADTWKRAAPSVRSARI